MVQDTKIIITDKFRKNSHKNWIRENHYVEKLPRKLSVTGLKQRTEGLPRRCHFRFSAEFLSLQKIINLKRISKNFK